MLLCGKGLAQFAKKAARDPATLHAVDKSGRNALFYAMEAASPNREHLLRVLLLRGLNYRQTDTRGVWSPANGVAGGV